MGTNCLIWCGVVLLLADEQRSSFMTNGHLSHVGGTSVLRTRLVCISYSAWYTCCIPILWEFRFPHLAVCLLSGTRLSSVTGSLRLLCPNSLGVLIPILSRRIMWSNFECILHNECDFKTIPKHILQCMFAFSIFYLQYTDGCIWSLIIDHMHPSVYCRKG